MDHVIAYGETLSGIAARYLGSPERWREIARHNSLRDPNTLFVGQRLSLPGTSIPSQAHRLVPNPEYPNIPVSVTPDLGPVQRRSVGKPGSTRREDQPVRSVPARSFLFVVADEIDPLRRKVVRKVILPNNLQHNPQLVRHILNPESNGFSPRDASSKVSVGRHVLGRTDSKYISASEHAMGSPRFKGERYWIDVERTKRSGAVVHDAGEIARDLDRIAAKTKNARFQAYIEEIRRKSLVIDREVLIEGHVSAGAIKGVGAMAATRGLQFVQGVGLVVSAYDLGSAAAVSYQTASVRPIAAESLRQAGGWAAAIEGMKLGAWAGGLIGIETGPGAVICAGVGGFIGGVSGYFGADWIADHIYAN
jgi:hypothetical protein